MCLNKKMLNELILDELISTNILQIIVSLTMASLNPALVGGMSNRSPLYSYLRLSQSWDKKWFAATEDEACSRRNGVQIEKN